MGLYVHMFGSPLQFFKKNGTGVLEVTWKYDEIRDHIVTCCLVMAAKDRGSPFA